MRKKEKRERKKHDRGIVDFMMVTNHFFHSLKDWIEEMNDPRNQSYITYTQADLGYMAILKNVCGQHSMREMEDGKTVKQYFHKVLEAKIVLSEHVIISMGTEFIENEKEDVSKQDCEINAAKRLLKKIKKAYPRRCPVCNRTIHEPLLGGVPLGVSFYTKRYKTEKTG